MTRPRIEVADVIRAHGDAFLDAHGDALCPEPRRALHDLASCRTAALGGHVEACDRCGYQQVAYNSCRNRHCPKCQGTEAARWVEDRAAELLPVEYYVHAEAMAGLSSRTLEKRGFVPDELHIASNSCDYRAVSQSRSPLSFCQEGTAGVSDLILAFSKARRFMSRSARA